jgi:hypothetical protein
MIRLTVAKLLDAIEQNGLPKIKGEFIEYDGENDIPMAGCAMGQAAINLNTTPYALNDLYYNWLGFQKGFAENWEHGDWDIVFMNDHSDLTLPEIAQRARLALKDELDVVIGVLPE